MLAGYSWARGFAARVVMVCYTWLATALPAQAAPPQVVPDGLSAQQYYELGQQYKLVGWTEQARDALNRAIKADPRGVGKQAEIYLRGYIPRYPVSQAAVQKNIEGFNMMVSGEASGAIAVFEDCIREYPNFEWPYGNLGSVYVQQGKTKQAREVLHKALAINPNYVNAWLHLAQANIADHDYAAARDCCNHALQADPTCTRARQLLTTLNGK